MFSGTLLDLRDKNKNKSSHLGKLQAATFSAKTAKEHIHSLGKSVYINEKLPNLV